jgi:hypothetical protein
MMMFFGMVASWFSGPFVKFLKAVPAKAWYVILALSGIGVLVVSEKRRSYKKGKEETLNDVVPEIKKQDKAREKEADEILNDKVKEIRNEPIKKPEPPNVVSTTDELPSSSELRSNDPERYRKLFGDNRD